LKEKAMERFLQTMLIIHIIAGSLALLAGTVAILTKKGSRVHNKSGKIYYWSMILIGLTAFSIAIPKGNMFLLMIGGFSTYMTLTGYRYLQFKRNPELKYGNWDFTFILIGFLTLIIPSIYFTNIGWTKIGGFAIVFGVFGLFLFSMLIGDIINSKKISSYPKTWFLQMHITRMMGAFIATFTAFLVINWESDPVYIAWLLPTVIFTPLIIYFRRKYQLLKKGAQPMRMN
jgi:uncharacterized membrane protein